MEYNYILSSNFSKVEVKIEMENQPPILLSGGVRISQPPIPKTYKRNCRCVLKLRINFETELSQLEQATLNLICKEDLPVFIQLHASYNQTFLEGAILATLFLKLNEKFKYASILLTTTVLECSNWIKS